MNKSPLLPPLAVALGMALLAGCASSRPPLAAVLRGEPVADSTAPPAAPPEMLRAGAAQPLSSVPGEGWHSLFDGSTFDGWRMTEFGEGGRVELQQGLLVLRMGTPFTGVNYTNAVPKQNYEVTLEAMRVEGDDFFCGLTVPVGDTFVSLIVGGWGGTVVGISSIDGDDASENETSQTKTFEQGRWYRIRLRVSEQKIEAWLDEKKLVDVVTTGHRLSLRIGEIELSKPFGIAAWATTAAIRDIRIRSVAGPAAAAN